MHYWIVSLCNPLRATNLAVNIGLFLSPVSMICKRFFFVLEENVTPFRSSYGRPGRTWGTGTLEFYPIIAIKTRWVHFHWSVTNTSSLQSCYWIPKDTVFSVFSDLSEHYTSYLNVNHVYKLYRINGRQYNRWMYVIYVHELPSSIPTCFLLFDTIGMRYPRIHGVYTHIYRSCHKSSSPQYWMYRYSSAECHTLLYFASQRIKTSGKFSLQAGMGYNSSGIFFKSL